MLGEKKIKKIFFLKLKLTKFDIIIQISAPVDDKFFLLSKTPTECLLQDKAEERGTVLSRVLEMNHSGK